MLNFDNCLLWIIRKRWTKKKHRNIYSFKIVKDDTKKIITIYNLKIDQTKIIMKPTYVSIWYMLYD